MARVAGAPAPREPRQAGVRQAGVRQAGVRQAGCGAEPREFQGPQLLPINELHQGPSQADLRRYEEAHRLAAARARGRPPLVPACGWSHPRPLDISSISEQRARDADSVVIRSARNEAVPLLRSLAQPLTGPRRLASAYRGALHDEPSHL